MSFDRAARLFEELISIDPSERGARFERLVEAREVGDEVLDLVRAMLAGEAEREPGFDRAPNVSPASSTRLTP